MALAAPEIRQQADEELLLNHKVHFSVFFKKNTNSDGAEIGPIVKPGIAAKKHPSAARKALSKDEHNNNSCFDDRMIHGGFSFVKPSLTQEFYSTFL